MVTGEQIRKISTYLSWFYAKAESLSALNMHDINIDAEEVFRNVLNITLDCNMINLNQIRPNYPAVDLGDQQKGIAVQAVLLAKIWKQSKCPSIS